MSCSSRTSSFTAAHELGEQMGKARRASAWNKRAQAMWCSRLVRQRQTAIAAMLTLTGILIALGSTVASADTCPNAALRTGASSQLPDCRAYEQASPVDKNGGDVGFTDQYWEHTESTASGSAVAYGSSGAFAGAPGDLLANEYVATRGSNSWATTAISPPLAPHTVQVGSLTLGVSADLTKSLALSNVALTPDAVAGNENLYLRDNANGSYQLITTQPPASFFGWSNDFVNFDGGAADFSHVIFDTPQALDSTPAPPSGAADNVYDWTGDQLKLIGVLPDGTPDPNGAVVGESPPLVPSGTIGGLYTHAVSDDGTRVYWSDPTTGALYLRQSDASTAAITVSQATGGSSTPQPGYFWFATADGSDAYFTSTSKLTDSTSVNYGDAGDLYQYDAASGKLSDISVDTNSSDPNGADVQGVLGVGSSTTGGTYVYFIAQGVLTNVPNARGQTATAAPTCTSVSTSTCNLYVWHEEGSATTTQFIGKLTWTSAATSPGTANAANAVGGQVEDVSPDGRYLTFLDQGSLTGYDNTDVSTGNPDSEVYLYDAQTGTLTCPSCDPNGSAPTGPAALQPQLDTQGMITVPRNVLDDGRLFFDSPDQLVPQDTNQAEDVYEYEPDGVGSCAQAGGCLYLISTGRGATDSYFADASASGNDVFFVTDQQLVGEDTDNSYDLYDARVDGGLASQNPPPPAVPCSGDACRGQPSSSSPPPAAATVSFVGPGNTSSGAPAPKVEVLTSIVHGATFSVRVKVPGRGTITISGRGIKAVRRAVGHAGT